jgi:hypothetical protein
MRSQLFAFSALILSVATAQPRRIANPIDATRTVLLKDNVHPLARAEYDRGRVDPAMPMNYLRITLKPSAQQQNDLERLLSNQQNPSSQDYHRWLTPEQFGQRFGIDPVEMRAIASWLRAQGLIVERTARARNWIAFSGTAAQVEAAFRTELHHYSVAGKLHFANAVPPSVPAALQDVAGEIQGLHDFEPNPMGIFMPDSNTANGSHVLAPDDFATIYDLNPLYQGGIDGTGQKIVIVGNQAIDLTDIRNFRAMFGLPVNDPQIYLAGASPSQGSSAEPYLDLEWAGAVARNATLIYVYSNSIDTALQAAVDQNLAPVISESYGSCEMNPVGSTRALAQQANAQGITWLNSSGDSGAAGCDNHGDPTNPLAQFGYAVSLPASLPEVTAVGGTEFNEGSGNYWSGTNTASGASALSYIPEMAWNESSDTGLRAGGGGASVLFAKPAWQDAPGVPDDNSRDVPDVSLASALHDGYRVIANGQTLTAGGTSASSPSFAGVLGLLNQYLGVNGAPGQFGLGNINPTLYRLASGAPSVFHDITNGGNLVPCARGNTDCATGVLGYVAGPGYDLATGLGSIDAYNFVTQWNTPVPATAMAFTVSPATVTWGDQVQLVAKVTSSAGTPSGAVIFTSGTDSLGSVDLKSGSATVVVSSSQLRVGANTITATYAGSSGFSASAAAATIGVAGRSSGSAVSFTISPSQVHLFEWTTFTLTEQAGVGTQVTAWTVDGSPVGFQTPTLGPLGTYTFSVRFSGGVNFPALHTYTVSGVDPEGTKWTQTGTVTVTAPVVTTSMKLLGAPSGLMSNPGDATCPYSQRLILQEENGLQVLLTRFLAGNLNLTGRIQTLFGTAHLAAFGSLEGTLCLNSPPSQATIYEFDGTDEDNNRISVTMTAPVQPAAAGNPLAVSQNPVALSVTDSSQQASAALGLTVAGPWTVSVTPSNAATEWLAVTPASGTGPSQLSVTASGSGLASGVYNATILVQAANASPPYLEVPVTLVVGVSDEMKITGAANAASFETAFAPGMLVSVFGKNLAPSEGQASFLPLPLGIAGVMATVNGVAAPLLYSSPEQLNIQIPYEVGSGTAVIGIVNNGQAAAYTIGVAVSAPGIFSSGGSLVPVASA